MNERRCVVLICYLCILRQYVLLQLPRHIISRPVNFRQRRMKGVSRGHVKYVVACSVYPVDIILLESCLDSSLVRSRPYQALPMGPRYRMCEGSWPCQITLCNIKNQDSMACEAASQAFLDFPNQGSFLVGLCWSCS